MVLKMRSSIDGSNRCITPYLSGNLPQLVASGFSALLCVWTTTWSGDLVNGYEAAKHVWFGH